MKRSLTTAALVMLVGQFVSPAPGVTRTGQLLIAAGAATLDFCVILFLFGRGTMRPAPRRRFPVNRWLLVAMGLALAALAVYSVGQN